MEILNQIGHLQHWGLTPAGHLLKHYPFASHPGRPLRLLVSGTADIRHILKTLCDLNESSPDQKPSIEIYLHETSKELLCRDLLFLHILHETTLNFEERIELYLDLYGNSMIKYPPFHPGNATPATSTPCARICSTSSTASSRSPPPSATSSASNCCASRSGTSSARSFSPGR